MSYFITWTNFFFKKMKGLVRSVGESRHRCTPDGEIRGWLIHQDQPPGTLGKGGNEDDLMILCVVGSDRTDGLLTERTALCPRC